MQANPGGPVNAGNSVVTPESQSNPIRTRGTSARTCTAISQASLGVALIVTNVIILSVGIPFTASYMTYSSFLNTGDKLSCGIWCGALFIVTSAFGLFSRRSQVVITLYMVLSSFVSFLAFCGITWSCALVAIHTPDINSEYYLACEPRYPLVKIANISEECIPNRDCNEENCCVTMQEIDSCYEKARSKLITLVVCYAILIICFVVALIVSIVGASFTCIGLECCRRQVFYYQTQAPQLTGQPGQSAVHSTQQHPVGLHLPAVSPMVQIAPMLRKTSPPRGKYLIPDAPPAYQSQIYQQEYAYADEIRLPASALPSVNQGEGNGSDNDPLYTTVV